MHSLKEEVDTKVGHQENEEEYDDEKVEEEGALEEGQTPTMEKNGIGHHGEERPYLFGIPTPIRAPGDASPYGAEEDAHSEEEYGGVDEQLAHGLESPGEVGASGEVEDDRRKGDEEGKGKEGVGDHDDGDVCAEPGRREDREKGGYLWIHRAEGGNEECEACHLEGGGEQKERVTAEEGSKKEDDEGDEEHGLIAVGKRDMSGDVPPEGIEEGDGKAAQAEEEPEEAMGPQHPSGGRGRGSEHGSHTEHKGEEPKREAEHEEKGRERVTVVEDLSAETQGREPMGMVRSEEGEEGARTKHGEDGEFLVGLGDCLLERIGAS